MITKSSLYIAILLIMVGCGSVQTKPKIPVFQYSHPDHGIVQPPHEYHKKDRDECRGMVYSKGVEIDGVITTDKEVIDKYTVDSIMFSMRNSEIELRKKLAASGGKPLEKQQLNHDPSKTDSYYSEAKRVERDINTCMLEKGWVKVE